MAREGAREGFGQAARDLERLRAQSRALTRTAEAEAGVLSRSNRELERFVSARRRAMSGIHQYDEPIGPDRSRALRELRERARAAQRAAIEETQSIQRELNRREGILKSAQTRMRKAQDDPMWGTPQAQQAAIRAERTTRAQAAVERARANAEDLRQQYAAGQQRIRAAADIQRQFERRVREDRTRTAPTAPTAVADPVGGSISPAARNVRHVYDAWRSASQHVREAAPVHFDPTSPTAKVAMAGYSPTRRSISFFHEPESLDQARNTLAHEAYHARTYEGIQAMSPQGRARFAASMNDLMERVRQRVLSEVKARAEAAGTPVVQGTRLRDIKQHISPAEFDMLTGRKQVEGYYKGPHIEEMKASGAATFNKSGAWAHEGGARLASFFEMHPDTFRQVATPAEVSWFSGLMSGGGVQRLTGGGGSQPPRRPRPTAQGDRPDRPEDSGHENFRREAEEIRRLREERERLAADEEAERQRQRERGVTEPAVDREARAAREASEAKEREARAERQGRSEKRAARDEIERNTKAREAEARSVDHTAEAEAHRSQALVPRTPQAAGYNTRAELRAAEARAGLAPGPQFGDYPTTAGPPHARGIAGPAGPGDHDFERPIDPEVRDRFRADRNINAGAADGMEKQRRAASNLTEEEERLRSALTAEQRAQHEDIYNRARSAIDRQADAQRRAAGVTRLTAAEFGAASQSMRRHGALTSEWIAAAARGETTMRELGFQVTATIGKFAGWTAAASLVYGVVGAVHQLGTGAMATQGGVHQLSRVINNVNPAEAGQGFRDLAEKFNVPIDVAADAVYRMGQRFHSVPEAMQAAEAALYSFKTGEVDVGTATQNLLAVVNGFGLSADQLTQVYDKINQAQNQFGINIGDTEAGLAKAAGTYRNAGGDLDYLLGLFVAISRATGRTGQEIGTGIARGVQRIRQPEGQRRLRAQGVEVDPNNFQSTLQSAMAAARRGADVQELATGLLGNQYARLLTATLKDQTLLNEAVGPEFAKNAKGSAARELAKVLQQVDEQIRALGVGLQEIGAALADTHLLDPLGGFLKLLNLSLDVTRELIEAFNSLPEPLRQAVSYLGEAAAFMALMRRAGPASLAGRFPALSPLVRAPEAQLQTLAKRGARDQLAAVNNESETLLKRRTGEAIRLEASRAALTDWDKRYAAQMEAAPKYSQRRLDLAAQRVALEQQLQGAEAAHLRSLHETQAVKVAQIRAEEELATISRMRPGQVANYLRENRIPIPRELDTPSSRGTRLVGSPFRTVSNERYRDFRNPDYQGFTSPYFVGSGGRWEEKTPPPANTRMYNPRFSRGWTQAREAMQNQVRSMTRTMTEFARSQSVTQRILGPLAAVMMMGSGVTRDADGELKRVNEAGGHTGRAFTGLTRSSGRLRTGLASFRRSLPAVRASMVALRQSIMAAVAGMGLLDGLFLGFIAFDLLKQAADKNSEKVKEHADRLKQIGTPTTRGELTEQRRLMRDQAEKHYSLANDTLSSFKAIFQPSHWLSPGDETSDYDRARKRREQALRDYRAQQARDARLQQRDMALDRPVHHRLAPDIARDAKRASEDAAKGISTIGEFNAAIDQGIAELYRSRYIKPSQRGRGRRELERLRRTTLGQLDPSNFAERFDNAGMDELSQQFEISAMQLARPGRRGDNFHMRELRAIFNRIVRRGQNAKTPQEIKAALQAEEEMYKAIEAEMQSNLELDLGTAKTEAARQRAFRSAIRFAGTMSRDARGRERASGQRLRKANADLAKRQQQMDEAQADAGAIPDTSNPLAPGAFTRPITNISRARQNLEDAKRKQREARAEHEKDAQGVKDANERVRIARQELRQQQYDDAEQGANIDRDYAISQLAPGDKEGRRRIELDFARKAVARAKRYRGPERARKIKQANTALNNLVNQQSQDHSQDAIEAAQAAGALAEARAGVDPVARARAALGTARRVLTATRANKEATKADRDQALAAVIQAETDTNEAIRQRAITVEELSFDIAAARAKGDPIAEARAAQQKAALHLRKARTPEERQQAILEQIQANNQMEQSVNDREQARYEFLASQTDDPVRQAGLRARAAHAAVGHAQRGSAEWYRARATENQERRNQIQARIDARRDDIDFNLEMEKISKDTAISQYRSLLNTHGITKQARRDILRRIKQLQDESDQEASGFALDVGQIKLPTVYDVRRAMRGVVANMQSTSYHDNSDATVNVYVSDANSAQHVYGAIDRALRTSVRARMRTAGMRG